MAILGPSDLPVIYKGDSNPLKFHALSQLGHPVVNVEITEPQMEQILRSTMDWVIRYFPMSEKYAYFYTQPLQSTYSIPDDAFYVRSLSWDPVTTQIQDIFGAESYLFNVGNITGIQNILLDYFAIQSYRKFSARILGTEGHWEFKHETKEVRLFPVPRGSYPVVIQYLPIVTEFKSPQARETAYRFYLARVKQAVGNARRKLSGLPGPDGGSITTDGDKLTAEGDQEIKDLEDWVIKNGEPAPIIIM